MAKRCVGRPLISYFLMETFINLVSKFDVVVPFFVHAFSRIFECHGEILTWKSKKLREKMLIGSSIKDYSDYYFFAFSPIFFKKKKEKLREKNAYRIDHRRLSRLLSLLLFCLFPYFLELLLSRVFLKLTWLFLCLNC